MINRPSAQTLLGRRRTRSGGSYDCFISYSSHDAKLAGAVHRDLELHGLSVFCAQVSLQPGQHWSRAILDALRNSDWVIFLAGKAACESPFVLQEMGGAIYGKKRVVPVVWDCSPSDLPGWTKAYQALDLRGMTPAQMRQQVFAIARGMRATKRQKATGALVVGSLLLAFLATPFADEGE